jgi:hypothetical protein
MTATYTNENVKFNGTLYSSYVMEVDGNDKFLIPVYNMDSIIAADIEALDISVGPLPAANGVNLSKTFILANGTSFYDTYRGLITKVGATPEHASPVDSTMKYWNGSNWVVIV